MTGRGAASVLIALFLALGSGPDAHAIFTRSKKPKLEFPLACTLDSDCWITRYMDRGIGHAAADHACRRRTEDGHTGIDIAVSSFARIRAGVPVIAVAEGTVLRQRDGMPDEPLVVAEGESVSGKECGNGLVLDIGNDWLVQYCHMKKGSLRVKAGDKVFARDLLGEMGVSGLTEYPHLHVTLRHKGVIVDPFGGGEIENGCDRRGPRPQMWKKEIREPGIVLLPPAFSTEPRTRDEIWNAPVAELTTDAGALVLNGRAFHARKGDRWDIKFTDPHGHVVYRYKAIIQEDRQLQWRYAGLKKPKGGWVPGLWRGEVKVTREGYPPQSTVATVVMVKPDAAIAQASSTLAD